MPYLNLQTNKKVMPSVQEDFLREASSVISQELGKPEKYFMGAVVPEVMMMFNQSLEPTAFVEMAAIGVGEDKTQRLTEMICDLAESHFQIPADRVYVRIQKTERTMWGWNSTTFG